MWDAFKAFTRGDCISAIKTARVNDNEEINHLKQRERECAETHAGSPTRASYETLLEARRRLSLHVKGLTSS